MPFSSSPRASSYFVAVSPALVISPSGPITILILTPTSIKRITIVITNATNVIPLVS